MKNEKWIKPLSIIKYKSERDKSEIACDNWRDPQYRAKVARFNNSKFNISGKKLCNIHAKNLEFANGKE
jgi:hypothetical protein